MITKLIKKVNRKHINFKMYINKFAIKETFKFYRQSMQVREKRNFT